MIVRLIKGKKKLPKTLINWAKSKKIKRWMVRLKLTKLEWQDPVVCLVLRNKEGTAE